MQDAENYYPFVDHHVVSDVALNGERAAADEKVITGLPEQWVRRQFCKSPIERALVAVALRGSPRRQAVLEKVAKVIFGFSGEADLTAGWHP